MKYYGALEAGGTKFLCAVVDSENRILTRERIPTTSPEETIARTHEFFRAQAAAYPLAAIGIATFGPVDLNPNSPTYGYITSTPKPGWKNTDLLGAFQEFHLPCGFDTDVNGAALAEYKWGNPNHADSLVYYTIGTGIGAGAVINGAPIHGLLHPEAGHVMVRRDPEKDPYAGHCPYHGDCLEGLCSGPAIAERLSKPAEQLAEDDPVWEILADYLAQACAEQILMLSPGKIVLGGGVMHQEQLFPLIRKKVQKQLNGYIQSDTILNHIDAYITPPALGDQAGILGAAALAELAENKR